MNRHTLVWHDAHRIDPDNDSGLGEFEDEFLVCFTLDGEEHVEVDRWLGHMWKHRSPSHWAVIPLPSDS